MVETSLEERVAALEAQVAELRDRLDAMPARSTVRWWEQRFGAFANDPEYDEATRLGREYRESLRPQDGEEAV